MRPLSGAAVLSLFALVAVPVPAQLLQAEMTSLTNQDPLYLQHQELVTEYHRNAARGLSGTPPLLIRHRPRDGETLFTIASRLSLPYSAIATLNGMSSPELGDRELLIPTQPGLFVRRDDPARAPLSTLEREVAQRLASQAEPIALTIHEGETVLFYPGTDFSPQERSRFLSLPFVDPLPSGVVSSRYGFRTHPITGLQSFHQGLDIAAPFGTAVVSAADGVIRSVTRDRLLGLMVTIDHRQGYTTRYAHLQESLIEAGAAVSSGAVIGRVGSTGLSSGPHLHFEIRRGGIPRDPEQYLR